MKTTTKLLLGATVVVGFSISAFAACATDVDMGAKKLTNVADGSADGDAVNYGQLLGVSSTTSFTDVHPSIEIRDTRITKIGNICQLYYNTHHDVNISNGDIAFKIPVGFRAISSTGYTGFNGYYHTQGTHRSMAIFSGGDVKLSGSNLGQAASYVVNHMVYACK